MTTPSRRQLQFVFVSSLLCTVAAFAENFAAPTLGKANTSPAKKAAAPAGADAKPIFSALGRQRLLDNIAALAGNVRVLEENIIASQKNVATLQAELNELEALEREHKSLQSRYVAYLREAKREMQRNERASDALSKQEPLRQMASTGGGETENSATALRGEKLDRTRWKLDAQEKHDRVQSLLQQLNKNLNDVLVRKSPLQDQIVNWQAREKQYRDLLAQTMKKRQEYEKYLQYK